MYVKIYIKIQKNGSWMYMPWLWRKIMVRKTREEAWKTREKILLSSFELFSKYGFDKTNLSDIAVAAGVTRGAVYWHFENKDELFMELLKYLSKSEENYYENFRKIEINQSSPLLQFRSWLLDFRELLNNKQKMVLFQMMDSISISATASNRIKTMIREQGVKFIEKIASFLNACVRSGELPADLDVNFAAMHIYSVLDGYFRTYRNGYSNILERELERIIDLVLNDVKLLKKQ